MAELVCVDPKQIRRVWPHVKDLLRRANERTQECDWENEVDSILAGDSLLWIAWDGSQIVAAATTELKKLNGSLRCYITGCGGSQSQNWLHLICGLEKYAADEGCKSIRILGRQGWRKVLPDYVASLVLLEKELP